MATFDDDDPSAFSQQVGDRLRVIRKQKRLSLQEVEAQSALEFKASVLGAYERGDMVEARAKLRRSLETHDAPLSRALWWRLRE